MSESPNNPRQDDVVDTDPFGDTVAVGPKPDPWDRHMDLRAVARAQRVLLYWIAIVITVLFLGVPLAALSNMAISPNLVTYLFWGATFITATLVGRLNWFMGENAFMTALAVLFTLIPLMNVINVLFANWGASGRLRDAGVHVGFFGTSEDAVIRATSPWCCNQCGYDLTANTSGRCPECGRALSEEARSAIIRRAADLARDAGAA